MGYSGAPTPNKVTPQTFRCVSIFIPDCIGDEFFSYVLGQIGEMGQEYYWKQEGDLTPAEAAFLMSQALALTDANGETLCGDIMDCNDVANCIDTSPEVQLAINTTIINQGIVNSNTIISNVTILTDRIPDPETAEIAETGSDPCDLDAIWAGIRSMVERIDGNGRDILEDLAVINDKIQQWGELIDLVPILGDTIKDIGDLFTEQIPDMLNQYNSASSPTFLDNVACDLFQMVCNDCRYPTYDEILNYFGQHSYVAFPDMTTITYATAWDIIKIVPLLVPEALWYTINTWQCLTLAFDGVFGRSYGKRSFEIWASFGEDNPNDNWIILCDGCEPPQFELFLDFSLGTGIPPLTNVAVGSFVTDHWHGANLSNERKILLSNGLGGGFIVEKFQVDYSLTGVDGTGRRLYLQGVQTFTVDYPATRAIAEYVLGTPQSVGNMEFRATSNRLSENSNYDVYSLRFFGSGTVPAAWLPYVVS